MKQLVVRTASRTYPIWIEWGILGHVGKRLSELIPPCRVAIISDTNVWACYGEEVEASLKAARFDAVVIVREPGEAQKSLDVAGELYDALVDALLDRKSCIVALGGGVVGDLAGFIAATYMRGIHYVQVPTSLLAQVDSSVGGKVAINHPKAKNLIGSFYQPAGVFIDPAALKTLPSPDFTAGMAEVIKYGFIWNAEFIDYLRSHREEIMALSDREAIEHIIALSCAIKAEVVSKDEKESGLRTILNYGHTVGHAIEAADGYGHYRHGEAVAIGMIAAARISEHLGLSTRGLLEAHIELLSAYGLPTYCPIQSPEIILDIMRHDKKSAGGRLRFVLASRIGKVIISDEVTGEVVLRVLHELSHAG